MNKSKSTHHTTKIGTDLDERTTPRVKQSYHVNFTIIVRFCDRTVIVCTSVNKLDGIESNSNTLNY